jgi:hypothetical protein
MVNTLHLASRKHSVEMFTLSSWVSGTRSRRSDFCGSARCRSQSPTVASRRSAMLLHWMRCTSRNSKETRTDTDSQHRGKFRPNTWQRPPVSAARRSMAKEKSPRNSPQHVYTGLPRPSTTSENTLGLTLSPKDVPPPLLEQDTTLVNNPPLHPIFLRGSLDSREKTPRSSSQTGRPESLRLSETGDSLVGAMLSGDSSADPNRTFVHRTTPTSAPPMTSTSTAPNMERSRSSGDRFSSLIRKHSDKLKSRISYLANATKQAQDEGTIIVEPDPEITWPETDVLEVWFAGSHSDVGGGNVKNGVRNSLANVSYSCLLTTTWY